MFHRPTHYRPKALHTKQQSHRLPIITAVLVTMGLVGGIGVAASSSSPDVLPTVIHQVGQSQEERCPLGRFDIRFKTGPLFWECNPYPATTTTTVPTTSPTTAPTTSPVTSPTTPPSTSPTTSPTTPTTTETTSTPTTTVPTTTTTQATTSSSTSTTQATTSTTRATTTTTTTVAPTTTTKPSGSWWVPGTGPIEFQWELDHALSTSSNSDMGYNETTYTGAAAPNPTLYDIDGIDNPASTVSALHALGDKVVCYIETGDVGNYYSASDEGIPTTYYAQFSTAGDLGAKQSGYPEYYLNINAPSTLTIIESMIKQQCAAKGFDAVETDNDETWQYSTGFSITEANDETYMSSIANYIHSLGMAWFVKNCDDVGNTSFCNAMYPLADAVITEQCNQYGTCSDLGDFVGHKAVFNAEYQGPASSFCPSDNSSNFNGVLFDANLDGKTRIPCR